MIRRFAPCTEPACPTLVEGGGRCQLHALAPWTNSTGTERTKSSTWRKTRLQILERDGRLCYLCGGDASTVDHKIPSAAGGTDHPSNLAACCFACQKAKIPEDREASRLAYLRDSRRGGGVPPNGK